MTPPAPDFERVDLAAIELAAWPTHVYDHISASGIKQFLRCPEQFRRRRIKDDKEPPAGALIWGTSHHAALERNYEQKVESHDDLPADDLQITFAEKLDEKVDEAGGPGEVQWGTGKQWRDLDPKAAHARVKDLGTKLVAAHREQVMPTVQPVAVEQEFELHVEGIPVKIVGFIDVEALIADPVALLEYAATGNFPEGGYRRAIIDQKTAGRAGISNENKVQGWVYQLAKGLEVDFHVALKTNTPRVVTPDNDDASVYRLEVAPTERTKQLIVMVMRTIAHYYAMYGPDHPWPGAFGGFADTCGYCGFKPVEGSELTAAGKPGCPWWTKGRWQPIDTIGGPLFG